jgi:hypothetical protein
MRITFAGERKYRSSTESSKMSDNDNALSVLGRAEIFAVEYLPFHAIPQLIKRGDDDSESSPTVMAEKVLDVFEDEMARTLSVQDSGDVEEQSSPSVRETSLRSRDAERLARETGAEEVEVGEVVGVDELGVSEVDMLWPVPFVGLNCVLVDLGIADALDGDSSGGCGILYA